jgi:hypothetical protein
VSIGKPINCGGMDGSERKYYKKKKKYNENTRKSFSLITFAVIGIVVARALYSLKMLFNGNFKIIITSIIMPICIYINTK